jgi:putative transposase
MPHHNTLLHHLGKAMPRWRFERLAKRRAAERRVRTLPCWSQFVALGFAQLAGISSLRELIAALASHANHADHLGRGPLRRSTLAEANAKRPLALSSRRRADR